MNSLHTLNAPQFDWATICRTKMLPHWRGRPGEYEVSAGYSGLVREAGCSSMGRFIASGGILAHGMVASTIASDFEAPVRLVREGSDWLTLHVIVSGHLSYDGGCRETRLVRAEASQAAVQVRSAGHSYACEFPDRHVQLVSIAIDPEQVAADFHIPGGGGRLRSVFEKLLVVDLSAKAMRVTQEMMEIDLEQPMALVRYQAKALELVAILLEPLLMQPVASRQTDSVASSKELRQLLDARAILDMHFDAPPTVTELALRVATNRTKLMKGFKAQFGVTVAEYALRLRMTRARELLANEEMGVAEVGFKVGYQHHSSFTAAFVDYFGESPTAWLERVRR